MNKNNIVIKRTTIAKKEDDKIRSVFRDTAMDYQ